MRAVYLWKTSVPVHIHIKDVRSDRFTKGATPHNTPYTIHVSIDRDRHVNFVRPSIRSHSVSFVCVFFCSLLLTLHLSRRIVLELTCILLSLETKLLL